MVKIPVAIPALALGTTLTDKPSIKPQGRPLPLPMPTSSMGKHH
ncbi:MAG: hypothetical protein ACSLEN_06020 [Candidatus Malihini olakiniferum]